MLQYIGKLPLVTCLVLLSMPVIESFGYSSSFVPRGRVSSLQRSLSPIKPADRSIFALKQFSGKTHVPTMMATSGGPYQKKDKPLLDKVNFPADIKGMSVEELKQLSYELRWEVIEAVSQTGGHLSSSLGVTELTVALHHVFDAPEDKIIWDVAHQAYPHKMLTGRRSRFPTLRQWGGLSGFTKRKESEYDCFGAGHSSTSISAALGMSIGKDLTGKKVNNCIAVIGDGAITGGMAWEAMNCASYFNQRMIVILNENGQVSLPTGSPSAAGVHPAGALSGYTSQMLTSRPFQDARSVAKRISQLLPADLQRIARKVDEFGRGFVSGEEGSVLFEELGFYYIGPVDGHDLDNLIPILQALTEPLAHSWCQGVRLAASRPDSNNLYERLLNLRDSTSKKPVLLHIKTEKGYGYPPALRASDRMHGVGKFDIETGKQPKSKGGPPTYTAVFANTLCELARQDPTVCGITAAMPGGTGMDVFGKFFPKRTFDVGIAEQHAVTMAAGMAVEGLVPFCAIYSTFLQRGYDQVVHDCVIQKIPVRFILDRAGLVGNDGPTHHGCYDLAYMGTLPNIVIMAPSDEIELMRMIKTAYVINDLPSVVRYPRGNGYGAEGLQKIFGYDLEKVPTPAEVSDLPIGVGRIMRNAPQDRKVKVAILSIGTRLVEAMRAARMLGDDHGFGVTVADARFMKPLDTDMIRDLVAGHDVLITVEEGSIGGFGSHVLQFVTSEGLLDNGKCRVRSMVIPDMLIEAGTQHQQYEFAGLHAKHIAATALRALDKPGEALELLSHTTAGLADQAPTIA